MVLIRVSQPSFDLFFSLQTISNELRMLHVFTQVTQTLTLTTHIFAYTDTQKLSAGKENAT